MDLAEIISKPRRDHKSVVDLGGGYLSEKSPPSYVDLAEIISRSWISAARVLRELVRRRQ